MESLYEDQEIKIFLEGKKVIITSAGMGKLDSFDEKVFAKIGLASTLCSAILFETLGAQGTNILMQDMEQFKAIIVPRKDNDGINFLWEPKNMEEAVIKEMKGKISDALDNPSIPKKVEPELKEEIEVISDMEEEKEIPVEEEIVETLKEPREETEQVPEEPKEEYDEDGHRIIKQNPVIRQLKRQA